MIHEKVLLLSVVLMLVVFLAFTFVFINSRERQDNYASITKKSYALRTKLFWFIGVMGVLITIGTTRGLPYTSASTTNEITVVGKQWYWELSGDTAKVNQPVVFNVTSADVNHGLGIYDKDLRLLGQVQAMPGYENKLSFTFEKTGKYQLMCMEYCGLVHHAMIAEFNVTQ